MGFEGTAVSSWCRGDMDVHESHYECSDTLELTCGDVLTGRTNAYCHTQTFTFTPSGMGSWVDMTTCGSEVDTELAVEKDGRRLYYSDNVGGLYSHTRPSVNTRECPDGDSSLITGMKLIGGETYKIVLDGWCGTVGPWKLSVDCSEFKSPPPTVSEPTMYPSKTPITSVP